MSKLEHFILDVDGVMTTGQFIYTADGKIGKIFGPHDADGLKLIRDRIKIRFITADARGLPITTKRIVDDMGYPLTLVSESDRMSFIADFDFDTVAYMGDGYHDAPILAAAKIGICPSNARIEALNCASFITPSKSAEGAVMDACLYLRDFL